MIDMDINEIIIKESQLFKNLAQKYITSYYFWGEVEDLVQELILKAIELGESKNKFETYNDFRNFLIRSLNNHCLNLVDYASRHGKKEYNELPENYEELRETKIEYKILTPREEFLLQIFDLIDEKSNIKKWNCKRLLNNVCKIIAEKENTDPHYILREFKQLAYKLFLES